jgi:formate dehydrogenase accessory protein FdhD
LDEIDQVNLDESKSLCRVQLKSTVNLAKRLKLSKHFSRVIFSACGTTGTFQPTRRLAKVFSDLKIEAEVIRNCVNSLNSSAKIFKKTGGVHAAAIYRKDGSLVGFAEDVGRHNAVDKVIGSCILRRNHFADCFLVLTGRLTGDIVMKAARTGIPIIASMAAAINSGIAVAKRSRITLVGFVRGNRMNVYTFPDRILV